MRFVFYLAIKHLLSSKTQSLLIIIAVALGVLLTIFIPAINLGFYDELLDKTINTSPHITIVRYDNSDDIDTLHVKDNNWELNKNKTKLKIRRIQSYKDIEQNISSINGIIASSPYVIDNGNIINGDHNINITYYGIPYKEYQKVVNINKDVVIGNLEALNPNGIAISQKIAEKLRVELNDYLKLSTRYGSKLLKIEALYNSGFITKDNTTVYVSINTAQALSQIGNQVDGVGIKVKNPWIVQDIAKDITYHTGLNALSWKDDNESLLSEIQSFNYITALINITIMLSVGAGVLGIMIILINSKHKQIGMLKALGVTSARTIQIFVLEGFILSILGAFVGSVIATLLIAYYNANPIEISENYGVSNLKAIYDIWLYIGGFSLAGLAGIIAALIPAYFVSKVDPAEVLKST